MALANKTTTKNITNQQELTSVGERKVLIIEHIEDLTDEQRRAKKNFSNDIALTRSIYKSIICKASIDNISININRKPVMVEFKPDKINEIFFLAFLKLTNIGQWKVSCRLPQSQVVTYGVIGPFGEDLTDAELTAELKEAGYPDVASTIIIKPNNIP